MESEYETVTRGDWTTIVSPGKFEGEHISAPYFWEMGGEEQDCDCLDDGEPFDCDCPEGECDCAESFECQTDHGILIEFEPEDFERFPELKGYKSCLMFEDSQGFVYQRDFQVAD